MFTARRCKHKHWAYASNRFCCQTVSPLLGTTISPRTRWLELLMIGGAASALARASVVELVSQHLIACRSEMLISFAYYGSEGCANRFLTKDLTEIWID